MNCPYCDEELRYHDWWYTGNLAAYERGNGGNFQKQGDIYKCLNEECEAYEEFFYTDRYGDLHNGYPC